MEKIIIYTDGSCIGNPGPGGWAFLVQPLSDKKTTASNENIFYQSGFAYHTTNNRMEMMAILQALKYLQENFVNHLIELNSDSNLLIQTLNQGWKRKANQDLWAEIDQARKNLKIKFFWVKAHADNYYNNLCDEFAQQASAKALKLIEKNPHLAEAEQFAHNQITQKNTHAKLKKPSQKISLPENSDQTSIF